MKFRFFIIVFLSFLMVSNIHSEESAYNNALVKKVLKENKDVVKQIKKGFGVNDVTPIFDPYNNNTLLGYIVSQNTNRTPVSVRSEVAYIDFIQKLYGFVDPLGNLLIPIRYSYLVASCKDSIRKIHLTVNTRKELHANFIGVFDTEGKVVVPCVYDKVSYSNPTEPKVNQYTYNKKTVWYKVGAREFHWVCVYKDGVNIISADGSRVTKLPKNYKSAPGYYFVDRESSASSLVIYDWTGKEIPGIGFSCGTTNNGPNGGLYTSDGRQILDEKYERIEIECSTNPDSIGDPYCVYQGGMKECPTKGIINLVTYEDVLPYAFAGLLRGKNKITIKRHVYGDWETYDPTIDYVNNRFPDDGAKYFTEGNFQKAAEYYASEGINAPMARTYSAMALYNIGNQGFNWYTIQEKSLIKDKEKNLISTSEIWPMDFNGRLECLAMAKVLMDNYLTDYNMGRCTKEDSAYHTELKVSADRLDELMDKMRECASRHEELLAYSNECVKKRAENNLAYAQRKEAERLEKEQKEIRAIELKRQQQQERNAELIASIFTSVISGVVNSSSSSSRNVKSAPSKGGKVAAKPSGGSSSSVKDEGPTQAERNRAIDIKKQIAKLEKQRERTLAAEPSRSATMLIENTERLINELAEELAELRRKGVKD